MCQNCTCAHKVEPKTVRELLKELNSDMAYAEFESVKEKLAIAIEKEKSVEFSKLHDKNNEILTKIKELTYLIVK